jgi:hypothetical protein
MYQVLARHAAASTPPMATIGHANRAEVFRRNMCWLAAAVRGVPRDHARFRWVISTLSERGS